MRRSSDQDSARRDRSRPQVANALVDEAPKLVKEGIDKARAAKLKAEIEEAGGTVELK